MIRGVPDETVTAFDDYHGVQALRGDGPEVKHEGPLTGCGRTMPLARFFPPWHSRCLASVQIEQPLATTYQS